MRVVPRPGRPSVLHVNHNNCVGGSALQMLRLARHQLLAGWKPLILTRPSPEWEAQRSPGGVEILFAPLRGSADVGSARTIAKLVRERDISIVHAHKGFDLALALLASVMAPIKGIVVHRTVSFPLDRFNSWKYRLKRVDRIVVVSAAAKELLVRSGRIDPRKITVVHRGLELERFQPDVPPPQGLAAELGLQGGEKVVGVVANIIGHKRHDVVLDAAATVVRQVPSAVFLLIGEATDQELTARLQRRRHYLGLDDKVRFAGFREDAAEVAKLFHVGVLSSSLEGFPNVLLEQMALKKPVVATNVGGVPEIVVDGETGILVPPGRPKILAREVIGLLEDPAGASRMGAAGRRRVERSFSMRAQVDKILNLYEEILAVRGAKRR